MSFRSENKFIINKNKIFEFKQWLVKNNYSQLFPKRKINSVYFDNKDLTIYKDSIEGTVPRKKIRIRTYSNEFFKDTNIFNYEIKISSVEGRYKISKKFIKDINNIFNGIFDNQYGMCYPILNVVYEREYYIQNKSRITIDTNIKYHSINGKILSKHHSLDHNFVVEDKTKYLNDSFLLESFSFENKRFSKYSNGIDKVQNTSKNI